jgi:hypothetical protein
MNTLGLARQYNLLTPRERFALLLAASARQDEFELSRLLHSAPCKNYSVSHHHGVVDSFSWLSDYHFTALLDLAGSYFEAFAELRGSRKKADEELWHNVLLLGYLFQTYLTGWHKFCADMNVDPENLWQRRPGFNTIKRADRVSGTRPGQSFPGAAFVQEGVARWLLQQKSGDPEAVFDDETVKAVRVGNADDMAAQLHVAFEQLMEKWR